jgi:hypothetical protein
VNSAQLAAFGGSPVLQENLILGESDSENQIGWITVDPAMGGGNRHQIRD